MILPLQINTSFVFLAEMWGIGESSLFYDIRLREVVMCLEYLSKVDGCIAFDMLSMVSMRIPCDLIGEVGVCTHIRRKASHKIRLNIS